MQRKPKRGRPPKPKGEKYRTPARQLGRVSDEHWQRLQEAAHLSGRSFTAWAVGILLREAEKHRAV